jgi:hypothetical protein
LFGVYLPLLGVHSLWADALHLGEGYTNEQVQMVSKVQGPAVQGPCETRLFVPQFNAGGRGRELDVRASLVCSMRASAGEAIVMEQAGETSHSLERVQVAADPEVINQGYIQQ